VGYIVEVIKLTE